MRIEMVDPDRPTEVEMELAEILLDSVAGGASVGFLDPLGIESARRWWSGALRGAGVLTWVAREADRPAVGVVQLALTAFPNGAHRADVKKLLVRRDARGRGVARHLMDALEIEARRRGRWLLMLDTETGSPAEAIYERWGWQRYGILDSHAATPDGQLKPTTFMSKRLTPDDMLRR